MTQTKSAEPPCGKHKYPSEIDQKMPIMSMLNKIKGAKKHEIKSALKRIRHTGLG